LAVISYSFIEKKEMSDTTERWEIIAYSIDAISSWQTELQENKSEQSSKSKITLPSLQRGFVWKPYQIEALWDSIFRGYPIGAVLMSLSNGQRELLDGQQRSTSIALGYYNPFNSNDFKEFLNLKENIPSIWIDLKPISQNKYGLKFGFRVLTRSHPWSYQLNDHRQTLTMSDRENALEYFRRGSNKKYTDFKSKDGKEIKVACGTKVLGTQFMNAESGFVKALFGRKEGDQMKFGNGFEVVRVE
jgi:uncharacterized protein with ParB-like and HNH nuclease domain